MDNFLKLTPEARAKRISMQAHLEIKIEEYSMGRYWKAYNNDPTSGNPEQQLIHQFVSSASKPYRAWLDYFKGLKASNQDSVADWYTPLFVLEPETIAAIVISSILNATLSSEVLTESDGYRGGDMKYGYQKLAKAIGKQVKDICNYRMSKASFLEDWKKQSHFLKSWEPKRCDAFAKKFAVTERWGAKEIGNVGNHLLHIASLSGVVHKESRKVRKAKGGSRGSYSQETVVYLDQELTDKLVSMHAIEAFLKMIYRPMIVPPMEHTLELAGGPLDLNMRKATVDGTSKPSQQDLDALNALQRTEWSVNEPVLAIMDTMFKNNWETCNLPPKDLERIAMPRVGPKEDCKTPEEVEQRKALIAERSELWSAWYKSDQKRLQMAIRLGLAKELVTLGFFYHSYTMDFRGRGYTACSMLSPQSGDLDRGLLKFATPVEQTKEGIYWTSVNLANLMDGAEGWEGVASDKATFDDRVAWVDANHDMLMYVADNPLEMVSLWADNVTTKKNPSFQRLAAIFDYAQSINEGTTSYPVQLDGACNGSQHWSALRRDESIARLTNVMPVDKPQDLYQYVADISTKEMIYRADSGSNDWCQRFVDHWGTLKRKVVKRATMCDAYGITPHGIRKYAKEEGHLDWVPPKFGKEVMAASVNELTALTIHGLNGAMEESNKGKDYVRYICDLYSEQNRPMTWTVPGGFHAVNRYVEYEPNLSRSALYGKQYILTATFGIPTNDIDGGGARGAIAPNFIHSFDAAHMRLAIMGMLSAGTTQFSMIHDSFGCPAPQVAAMRQIIKETFHEVHETNQLEVLQAHVVEQLGLEVDTPPAVGALDIGDVLRAEYLFG